MSIWQKTLDKTAKEANFIKINGTVGNKTSFGLPQKEVYLTLLRAVKEAREKNITNFIFETCYDLGNFNLERWYGNYRTTMSRFKKINKEEGQNFGLNIPLYMIKVTPYYFTTTEYADKKLAVIKLLITIKTPNSENLTKESIFIQNISLRLTEEHSVLKLILSERFNELDEIIQQAKKKNLDPEMYVKLQKNKEEKIRELPIDTTPVIIDLPEQEQNIDLDLGDSLGNNNINNNINNQINEPINKEKIEEINWEDVLNNENF